MLKAFMGRAIATGKGSLELNFLNNPPALARALELFASYTPDVRVLGFRGKLRRLFRALKSNIGQHTEPLIRSTERERERERERSFFEKCTVVVA
jgi:hypothetical protein